MNGFKRILSSILVLLMILTAMISTAAAVGVSLTLASKKSGSSGLSVSGAAETITVNGETLTLSDIDAIRDAKQEEDFEALTETGVFGESFVEALKALYKIYDADLYIWLANLYDPEVGGFYYSVSARDNEGFLPDLESTAQALHLLDKSGLDGVYNDALGETLSNETKLALYNFALGLRADDGYFYHPQWGTNITSARKGRDKGWGNDILNAFSSVAAEATALAYSYDKILTSSLCTSNALATSKVVLASSTTSVPQFSASSWDDLKAYIDYWLDVKKDSYTMGNTINSNIGTIQANGLRDELVEYLAQKQFDNGLWEEETSYNAINGLMKVCGFFGGSYASFPNASAALNSMMNILLSETDENGLLTEEGLAATETICYVYNPWITMYKLANTLKSQDSAAFDDFAELLKDNAPQLMETVYQKLYAFKKPDGGFSYYQDKTAAVSQGAPVAVTNTSESDVNSTGIAISTLRYVLRVYQLYCGYEFDIPSIYTEYDTAYFLEILESRTPVTKLKQLEKPITVTFDINNSWEDDEEWEDIETDTSSDGGVVLYPYHSVVNKIGDSTLDDNGNYKWFSSSVTASPTDAANMVLSSATYVIDGSYASSASSTQFNMQNAGVEGNSYVFEGKMYFDTTNYVKGSGTTVAQLWFANKNSYSSGQSVGIDVNYSGSSLTIKESNYYGGTGGETKETLASGIPTDEWVTLRFEVTKNYSSDGSTVESMSLKVYVNGTHKGTYDTGRVVGTNTYCEDFIINTFRISYYRTNASHFYLDDAYAARVAETASVEDYYPGSNTDGVGCKKPDVKYSVLVKDAGGTGISGVKLSVTDGESTYNVTTDVSGKAEMLISKGSWSASVVSAPSGYAYDSTAYPLSEENTATITLGYEIATYTVTAANADGVGVPGVVLSIRGSLNGTDFSYSHTTSETGVATFNAPACYTIWTVTVTSVPEDYVLSGDSYFKFGSDYKTSILIKERVLAQNINAKTIYHSDKISLLFRVDAFTYEEVASGDVNLNLFYIWADEYEAGGEWKRATLFDSYNTESAVFMTEGVAAYELGRKIYAVACTGDETGENLTVDTDGVIDYSVAEFLYSMLYKYDFINATDTETKNAADCYLTLLEYGRTSQIALNKNKDKLVTDSVYVYTDDANTSLDGMSRYAFALVGESVTVTPEYTGPHSLEGWMFVASDGTTETFVGSKEINKSGKIVPVF